MKIEASEKNGVVILKLAGHMNLEQIALLNEAVKEHRNRGRRFFIFNMIDVNDLSSSGISRVLAVHRDLEVNNGKLVLAEPSAVVEYVLDLARLSDVFIVRQTEAEALAEFG